MSKVVYVISNNYVSNQVKIGRSRHWFQRAKQLKVGTKTTKTYVGNVVDDVQLEKYLHKKYDAYRLPQSEWFHLNDAQVSDVIDEIKRHEVQPVCVTRYVSEIPTEPVHVVESVKPEKRPKDNSHVILNACALTFPFSLAFLIPYGIYKLATKSS